MLCGSHVDIGVDVPSRSVPDGMAQIHFQCSSALSCPQEDLGEHELSFHNCT